MKLRYGLYLAGLFLLFLTLFEIWKFREMNREIVSRQRELLRIRSEIVRKTENLDRLKGLIKRENIPVLSKEEALRTLMSEVERIRAEFGNVRILKDLRVEGKVWKMDIEVTFRPDSGEDLVNRIKSLTGKKAPVVSVSRLEVNQRADGTEVKVFLKIYQPFLEGGR
ncbi:MAG: hypothetical protein Q9N26_08485 [Aquificota bacterium]|nr:hypothetical protein [Aquificota bacterium]